MTFTFINSLDNANYGSTYYQDNTGKIEICCYESSLKITDFENLTHYCKSIKFESSLTLFKNIIKGNNINDVKSLINYLANNEEFTSYTFEKSRVFNPFIKNIKGKLEIKLLKKGNRLTKTQIKKILTHEDSEVVIRSAYTDDYAYDYAMNYFENVKISRLEALDSVFSYFNYASKEKDNSITLVVAGHSKTLIIKNKNLSFIEEC